MEQPISQSVIRLRSRFVTKGKNIKKFVKSQRLLDVHRQYLQTFHTDLKSVHFILAQSGTSIEFRPLSF